MSKVCVTGAAGFIAGHLTEALLENIAATDDVARRLYAAVDDRGHADGFGLRGVVIVLVLDLFRQIVQFDGHKIGELAADIETLRVRWHVRRG